MMKINGRVQIYFLMILFHSAYSFFKMPENLVDEPPCAACKKITQKFTEVIRFYWYMMDNHFRNVF
jgi:hypothetical protein